MNELGKEATEHSMEADVIYRGEMPFRSVFDNASVGITLVDLEGHVIAVNKADCDFLGYSQEEILGMHFSEFTYPDDLGIDQELLDSLSKGERSHYKIDKRYIRKDGAIVWGQLTVCMVKDDADSHQSIGIFCEDITEQKGREQKLRIKDSAIESCINAIAFADLEGNVTYINDAFLKMWGYDDANEVLGRPNTEFWKVEGEAEAVIRSLRNEGGWRGELAAKGKDGSVFDVELSANMVRDNTGKPIWAPPQNLWAKMGTCGPKTHPYEAGSDDVMGS